MSFWSGNLTLLQTISISIGIDPAPSWASLWLSFSNQRTGWFKSYLSNLLFRVNLENCYSDPSNITCRVPQGSILELLMFLIYVNEMPHAVKSNLFLYADDSCLAFQGKDVIEIEKQLNKDYANISEWFCG